MGIYSTIHKNSSIYKKYNIEVDVKGGASTVKGDYYPFIMYFNSNDAFTRFSGVKCEYSIIYNFGSFTFPYMSSSIFNEHSPYYSTFYGAYAVKPEDDQYHFGYLDGEINLEEMVLGPKYDLTKLVLRDLGCDNVTFDYTIEKTDYNANGYLVIDTILTTNSLSHKYDGFMTNYLQYGRPLLFNNPGESFTVEDYYGRIYVKYIEESNVTLFYYIITLDEQTLEYTDAKFLSEIRDNK